MISFVVPAHNEQALLGRTLAAIHDSARSLGESYEIVVANDASTDRTGDIARAHDARVTDVTCRQIAAARNAGARVSTGDVLIFVDADTSVTRRAVRAALRQMSRGTVGGGCCVTFDAPVPYYARVIECLLRLFAPTIGLAGGCFLYCTRRAFDAVGGFDETLFASEEVTFATALKRLGRFVVLREVVVTSGRKVRQYSLRELARVGLRVARDGRRALETRDGLHYWYGPR